MQMTTYYLGTKCNNNYYNMLKLTINKLDVKHHVYLLGSHLIYTALVLAECKHPRCVHLELFWRQTFLLSLFVWRLFAFRCGGGGSKWMWEKQRITFDLEDLTFHYIDLLLLRKFLFKTTLLSPNSKLQKEQVSFVHFRQLSFLILRNYPVVKR